jgi:hypothetical protein
MTVAGIEALSRDEYLAEVTHARRKKLLRLKLDPIFTWANALHSSLLLDLLKFLILHELPRVRKSVQLR